MRELYGEEAAEVGLEDDLAMVAFDDGDGDAEEVPVEIEAGW